VLCTLTTRAICGSLRGEDHFIFSQEAKDQLHASAKTKHVRLQKDRARKMTKSQSSENASRP
jgi:hypothetical protein